MKTISIVLAFVAHFFLGLWRLINAIAEAIAHVVILIYVVVKVLLRRFWHLFAYNYQDTYNSIYSRLGKPVCEICGKPKVKNHPVTFGDCCDRWTHDNCHAIEDVAGLINKNELLKAAALYKVFELNNIELVAKTLVATVRKMSGDPYKNDLFKRIFMTKGLSKSIPEGAARLILCLG